VPGPLYAELDDISNKWGHGDLRATTRQERERREETLKTSRGRGEKRVERSEQKRGEGEEKRTGHDRTLG